MLLLLLLSLFETPTNRYCNNANILLLCLGYEIGPTYYVKVVELLVTSYSMLWFLVIL